MTNRTVEFRKHRDAVKSVCAALSSSTASASSTGPVIETVSLLPSDRSSYAPLSTEDPSSSRFDFFTNSHSIWFLQESFGSLISYIHMHKSDTLWDAVTVGLPPSWVDDYEEIVTTIQHALVKISELTKAHSKALLPSFGDGKEDQRLIETLIQKITSLYRKSEVRPKKLSATSKFFEDSNVRKIVQVG